MLRRLFLLIALLAPSLVPASTTGLIVTCTNCSGGSGGGTPQYTQIVPYTAVPQFTQIPLATALPTATPIAFPTVQPVLTVNCMNCPGATSGFSGVSVFAAVQLTAFVTNLTPQYTQVVPYTAVPQYTATTYTVATILNWPATYTAVPTATPVFTNTPLPTFVPYLTAAPQYTATSYTAATILNWPATYTTVPTATPVFTATPMPTFVPYLTQIPLATPGGAVVATGPTLTKATQGSTGYSVQELKDAGRTNIVLWARNFAAGSTTTETAIMLTKTADTGASTSAVSFVITSGKRFRIMSITCATQANATATTQSTIFNFRINTAGAVTTSSTPIVLSAKSASAAVAGNYDRCSIPIHDGMEFAGNGTVQFGMTAASTYTTNAPTWDVLILGYEY